MDARAWEVVASLASGGSVPVPGRDRGITAYDGNRTGLGSIPALEHFRRFSFSGDISALQHNWPLEPSPQAIISNTNSYINLISPSENHRK